MFYICFAALASAPPWRGLFFYLTDSPTPLVVARRFSVQMINELNREQEELEVTNRNISSDIERSKGLGATSDVHRQAIFMSREDQINGALKRESFHAKKSQELMGVVEEMKKVVSTIFNKIGCSGAMAHQLRMDGITDSNIMQVRARSRAGQRAACSNKLWLKC